METLFVTAFLDLGIDHPAVKGPAARLAHFRRLAATGIPLVVFASAVYKAAIEEICREHANVTIQRIVELEDTLTYSECIKYKDALPAVRTEAKDTAPFLMLMNAKTDFVEEVARTTSYAQVAWIDFNVWHVVRDAAATSKKLQEIAASRLPTESVYVPGCGGKMAAAAAAVPWDRICWRFCGGFFVGHRETVAAFAEKAREALPRLLAERGGLTWEVNVWAELEANHGWCPVWYKADHNDLLFAVPCPPESTSEV
jgi:hypothetical protein